MRIADPRCPLSHKELALYGGIPYNLDWPEREHDAAGTEPNRAHRGAHRARGAGDRQARAEIQGRSVSDFVVAAAQEAAHRAIEETQVIRLSVEDQRAFAEAILNPPAPTPALRRAFRRHRELIQESR